MTRAAWLGLIAASVAATAILSVIGWPARTYFDFDFIPFYLASRLVLAGRDPYDALTFRDAFLAVGSQGYAFGGPFSYPLPVALLVVPFALLPFSAAAPAWFVSQIALGIASLVALGRRLFKAHGGRNVVLLIGLTAAMPATLVSLWLGQPLGFALAVIAAVLVLLIDGRPRAAGGALALAVLKPQIFLLLVPVLLFVSPARWRILQGLALGAVALLVPSLIVRPGWVGEWLHAATVVATKPVAHANTFGPFPESAAWLGWVLLLLLVAVYVVWWRRVGASLPQLYGAAVALSLAGAPYAWAWYDLVLAVPAAVVLASAPEPGPRRRLALIGLLLVLDVIPWPLYIGSYRTGEDPFGALMPILMLFLIVALSSIASLPRPFTRALTTP
jgi:hypothetical protein